MSDKEKSCCFFGHIIISDRVKPKLRKAVRSAIAEGYRGFYVGNHGGYDRLVLSVLKEARFDYPYIMIYIISSAPLGAKGEQSTKEFDFTDQELPVVYLGETGLSFRERIRVSVRKIVERCDLAICCAQEEGDDILSDIVRYARSLGIKVNNLMEEISYFDL